MLGFDYCIHINTHHCWELMKSVGYCGNLISSLPSVLKKMMKSVGTLSHGKFVPAVFHDEEHEVSWYLVMESLRLPFFCDEEDNEISGKLATAEHYSSVMKKATVWHLCGSLGYVPTLLLLQCLFTFELFSYGDRFLCNQSQIVTKKNARSMFVEGSTDLFVFRGYNNFLETGNSWLFGCKNFFFSWIGFALLLSGEFQNNQSFLFLLDWICIACVWRIPKRSILSSSPGLDLHCLCLENSKTINPFLSYFQTLLNVDCHCLDVCFWFLLSLKVLIVTAWCDVVSFFFSVLVDIMRWRSLWLSFHLLLQQATRHFSSLGFCLLILSYDSCCLQCAFDCCFLQQCWSALLGDMFLLFAFF